MYFYDLLYAKINFSHFVTTEGVPALAPAPAGTGNATSTENN